MVDLNLSDMHLDQYQGQKHHQTRVKYKRVTIIFPLATLIFLLDAEVEKKKPGNKTT